MKREIKNYPKLLVVIRWLFPKLEFVSTGLAGKLARKLFFTPLIYPIPKEEREMRNKAKKFGFETKGRLLMAYEWGEGPVVLLLHGWSGRGTQFHQFIKPLVDQGYKVVAFDAPGHGLSTGNYSDLVYFSESLMAITSHYYDVRSVIGHSMGGAATLYALKNGLHIHNAILIGTPSVAGDIIKNFQEIINGSEKMGKCITDYIQETYGEPFSYYSAQETAKYARIPIMVVHDENDREVSVRDAKLLMNEIKDGALLITKGLGHTKILKDKKVIEKCISFIQQKDFSSARIAG